MKTLILIISIFSFSVFAEVMQEALVSGEIKSFDTKIVEVIDRYGQNHKINRSVLGKQKIFQGEKDRKSVV